MSIQKNITVDFHFIFLTTENKRKLERQLKKLLSEIDELILSCDERSKGGTVFSEVLILGNGENNQSNNSYFGVLYARAKESKRSLIYNALNYIYPDSNINIPKLAFEANNDIEPKSSKEIHFIMPMRINGVRCTFVLTTNKEQCYPLATEDISDDGYVGLFLKNMIIDHIVRPMN